MNIIGHTSHLNKNKDALQHFLISSSSDTVEMDFRLTQDGELVWHHNGVYNGNIISRSKYKDLKLLTLDDVLEILSGDIALLLQAGTHSQLPILERSIKYAKIFASDGEEVTKYKNHLIAKALIAILFSNMTTSYKKNEIFKVIEVCHTKEFNFDSVIPGLGYTRSFSECFEIDSNGNFGESDEGINEVDPPETSVFSLQELAKSLEFTLISEGFQGNQMMYNEAMILQVRLNTIIAGKVNNYFDGSKYMGIEEFIDNLCTMGNTKAQIVNINLEDIDDVYAKVIVKIISKLFVQKR